jgi:Tol biopolymer transport system component
MVARVRAGAAAAVLVASAFTPVAAGSEITRVSIAANGGESDGASLVPALSADGRFVVFTSEATNLVAGDTNQVSDVFVYDRQTKTAERVSVADDGTEGDDASAGGALSADGRFVVFASHAGNLVRGDTNAVGDVFVRDRVAKTTERVSVGAGGVQADGESFGFVSISADGRLVAFRSFAANLVPGDTNAVLDVFVRDRQAGTTERVSVAGDGAQGDGMSFWPAISADGRFVAFSSAAGNLVAGDTNREIDVFVRDRIGRTTERVSVGPGGRQGATVSVGFPAISADGRFVAFASRAREMAAGEDDLNGKIDVFVRDRQAGTTERVSLAPDGSEADGGSIEAAISADGRFVAFYSAATNLVAGDTNDAFDVFLADRETKRIERLTEGAAESYLSGAALSADGRLMAFFSPAADLVPGDKNEVADVFVWER